MVKFFIGPMTKNIVDAIYEFSLETDTSVGLIPSRRQIEFDGGYVNNWTSGEFRRYTNGMYIMRDHAGPHQGNKEDDGYISLKFDCENFDGIHIDPWKKYPSYQEGLLETTKMIKFCHKINPQIIFEIGTEQSIRHFESEELDNLITDLKSNLSYSEFNQIKYLVIQSGTSLRENSNTGSYDKNRLINMLSVSKKHQLFSKEHNGDYQPIELIKEKFDLGLDSINIAPEFGLIETQTYLDEIFKNKRDDLFELFYKICFDSNRWVKWVSKDFDPKENKTDLIKICGHYIMSNVEFISEIKSQFPNIDEKIKLRVKNKLYYLHG